MALSKTKLGSDLDLTRDTELPDREQMERTRLARFADLAFTPDQYLDTKIEGYSRSQANVIGGFNEREELRSAIEFDEGFVTNIMRIPPEGRVAPHNHPTAEVLLPLEGRLTVMWGLDGESPDGLMRTELGRFDTLAIPAGVYRTFHNQTDREVIVHFTVAACRPPAPIQWPEWVRRAARESGWELTDEGVMRRIDQPESQGAA